MKRQTIVIDESKCDGCGACARACAEGVIRVIDGVGRLVNEDHCDGLGRLVEQAQERAETAAIRRRRSLGELQLGAPCLAMGTPHGCAESRCRLLSLLCRP